MDIRVGNAKFFTFGFSVSTPFDLPDNHAMITEFTKIIENHHFVGREIFPDQTFVTVDDCVGFVYVTVKFWGRQPNSKL